MNHKRRRRESCGSNLSLESMSMSSGEEENHNNDSTLQIVTNSSFLYNKKASREQRNSITSPQSSSQSNMVSPISVHELQSPTEGAISFQCSPSQYRYSVEVYNMMGRLGLKVSSNGDHVQDTTHWFHRLCPLMASMIRKTPQEELAPLQERLKRHLHQKNNGELSVSLVGAALLRLHPDVHERSTKQGDVFPEHLPSGIREKLYYGKFVPMRHILYGEALKQGCVRHIRDDREEVPAEPYPLNLMNESPPRQFVKDIRRPDIIRGITTHSITLGCRFPRLASNMHHLLRHLWILMYQDMMEAQAAMDLYDAYFQEFEKHLCLLTLMPMDCFPPYLIETVQAKYARNANHSDEHAEQ